MTGVNGLCDEELIALSALEGWKISRPMRSLPASRLEKSSWPRICVLGVLKGVTGFKIVKSGRGLGLNIKIFKSRM